MNNIMDIIALTNLVFTIITAFCIIYLTFLTLQHTAKPKINVIMLNHTYLYCNSDEIFVFEFFNSGNWYAKPTAVNVTIFFNFDPRFDLIELYYDLDKKLLNNNVKTGVGNMKFLKAKGLKLTYANEGEKIFIKTKTPIKPGKYEIRINAYSENGATIVKKFFVECKVK